VARSLQSAALALHAALPCLALPAHPQPPRPTPPNPSCLGSVFPQIGRPVVQQPPVILLEMQSRSESPFPQRHYRPARLIHAALGHRPPPPPPQPKLTHAAHSALSSQLLSASFTASSKWRASSLWVSARASMVGACACTPGADPEPIAVAPRLLAFHRSIARNEVLSWCPDPQPPLALQAATGSV